MSAIEVVIVLLAVVTGLALVARRLGLPDAVLLVVAGLVIGFLPGIPSVEIQPDLVFLLFLPPILFGAGYFTSIRDLRANLRPILLLAVGAVLFTVLVVGLAAQALVPGMPPAVAFALGAIVAPPDAIAATSVFRRLGAPRRTVVILEGESLLNDATALVALRAAVAAALTGTFSVSEAGLGFVVVAAGGLAVGVIAALVLRAVLARLNDPTLGIVLTMLFPFPTYVAAETLHLSGVLAVVLAGLLIGRWAPRILTSDQRVQGTAAWSVLIFVINGLVFILIGLRLPSILAAVSTGRSAADLAWLGTAIALTVILARFAWVFPATYLPRLVSPRLRARDPYPKAGQVAIVSWAGMRGVVSLAAALSLPATLADGVTPFPERDLVLFLSFAVIFATLVVQGLTLAPLMRLLHVVAGDETDTEVAHARLVALRAALQRLDGLAVEWPGHLPLIEQLRTAFEHRAEHIDASRDGDASEAEQEIIEHRLIRRSVIDAERDAVIELRDDGRIGDDALRDVERDLDLEELRMED
jgi:Na+/H+ antiporter